jgi:hypothetical protein
MPRISTLAALLAAIMLMIGGGAARAASCDACPPKCPMMAQVQTAKAAAHQHAPISGKGGKADDPCKESLLCQGSAVAATAPVQAAAAVVLASTASVLRPLAQLPAASRPPDRGLRPPIQL